MLILYSKLMRNVAALAVFYTSSWYLILAYFLGHPVYRWATNLAYLCSLTWWFGMPIAKCQFNVLSTNISSETMHLSCYCWPFWTVY